MELLTENNILHILESVKDPEIPVLSVIDLGIIRSVELLEVDLSPVWQITITPTYSGCPAMDVISTQIRMHLYANGISNFRLKQVLSPAWSTDWITPNGRQQLKTYGIAPPHYLTQNEAGPKVECPVCGSSETILISFFGSTACKSLYRCDQCLEPFDYFKCH